VLTTRGYTGLKHVWLGSTAERVVRHASCPVLAVRELIRKTL
jgi:nucleotide-binding universal stress UspA family protein